MGVIKDINDRIAPRTQELMEEQGLGLKQALQIAFTEGGYKYETAKSFKGEKEHDTDTTCKSCKMFSFNHISIRNREEKKSFF